MAISVLLRAFTPLAQLSTSIASHESVFRSVNRPMISWVGSVWGNSLSLGSRAFCSKPGHNDLTAQNETKRLLVSNPTKIVFKYVRADDEPQEDSKWFKIRRIVEIPTGDALFQLSKGGDKYYSLSLFFLVVLDKYMEAAKSSSGRKISTSCVVIPSLFKQHLVGLLTKPEAFLRTDVKGVIADKETEDSIPTGINPDSECIKISHDLENFMATRIWEILTSRDRIVFGSDTGYELTLHLDDFFDIRIWEIITNGDKTVLEIIVGELKRHGFDFTEDSPALQKLQQAVERAIARSSNIVKLNLPVPAGDPEMSTTISWGTNDDSYVRSTTDDCYTCCPQ